MNTTTLAATAARLCFTLPAGLLAVLKRTVAPAAPATRMLERGATTWIARPLGRTVTCESGTLWLTFDNESQDVILEAGQSPRGAKASKLAVHGLAAARVSIA